MKFIISLIINIIMYIILINALLYIGSIAQKTAFSFNYIYGVAVPVILAFVTTLVRNSKQKKK